MKYAFRIRDLHPFAHRPSLSEGWDPLLLALTLRLAAMTAVVALATIAAPARHDSAIIASVTPLPAPLPVSAPPPATGMAMPLIDAPLGAD
ncbi:MAG: hypothetical protein IPK66_14945 [Rhodospirillales bacterium]|nr:hypothetical protein [Rhodospirillales bacterium]